jgi:hypothetical protein
VRGLFWLIPFVFLIFSCNDGQSLKATDSLNSMNGTWELAAAECGDGPSQYWAQVMESHPVNVRKHVNNGQTIDYVIDSSNCLQTITSHIVPEGNFLFTKYGYQKHCSDACSPDQKKKCGPINTTGFARIQVIGNEMQISEKDDSACKKRSQPGPLTLRYRLIKESIKDSLVSVKGD